MTHYIYIFLMSSASGAMEFWTTVFIGSLICMRMLRSSLSFYTQLHFFFWMDYVQMFPFFLIKITWGAYWDNRLERCNPEQHS